MSDVSIVNINGARTIIPAAEIETLAASLRGTLITPDSPGYDDARTVWNAMVDRRPAMIIQCAGAADVMAAVRIARRHNALMAIRGAGHNIAGNAVCDDGIMIDLSPMTAVRIDPVARTARVEPGCTLRDFDHEAQAFGLATPTGINSTTGIAGLTLGGGFGWLSRKYGMTVDNLLSVDLVNASGEMVHASKSENSDLFWGVRGGGGNFGIVTSFEFALHPVGPEVLAGLIVHPFDDAKEVLNFYREFTAAAPDDVVVWMVARKAPPLPFLPEEWHGKEVIVLATFYGGPDAKEGERLLKPLREFGSPIADVIGPAPYAAWQQAFDPLLTPGARNYWKSHDFSGLSDDMIDTLIDYAGRLPGPECEIFLGHMGGAVHSTPVDGTAYPGREASYFMNVHTRWQDAAQDDAFISWARTLFSDMAAFATGGVYVNFMPADETDRVVNAYGRNYSRLAKLKAKYDPDNAFRLNQNIAPATGG